MADRILTFNGKTIGGPNGGGGMVVLRVPDPPSHTVTIGGRTYRTVTIGNQEWMAENLDYKFTGLNFRDSPSNPMDETDAIQAAYYNYDESTYGVNGNKYGLLYNGNAIDYLNQNLAELGIPTGWHAPGRLDWHTLFSTIGEFEEENGGKKLKSSTEWDGTDDYGFSAVPCGFWIGYDSTGFYNVGSQIRFWIYDDRYGSTQEYYYMVSGGDSIYMMSEEWQWFGCSIRLVKDLS